MKLKRKLFPVNVYDIAKTQRYLKDMAAQGYFIRKIASFAYFEKGEPEKRTYRLEPIMKKESRPQEEKLVYYEECGWNYVCTIASAFHLYETKREDFKELHTDPVTQSYAFERLNQKMRTAYIAILLMIPLSVGMLLQYLFLSDTPVLHAVKYGNGTYTVLTVLVTIVLGKEVLENRKKLRLLLNNLQIGSEMEQEEKYHLNYTPYIFHGMIVLLSILLILLNVSMPFVSREKKIAAYEYAIPTVRLADIEDHPGFEIEVEYQRSNLLTYDATELASSLYEMDESGVVKSEMWEDKSGVYTPSLRTQYYKLRFGFLAESLMKDLMVDALDFHRFEPFTLEEHLETSFDQAVTIRLGETQMFFARIGNKVVYLNYHGYKDLSDHQDELHEIISTF